MPTFHQTPALTASLANASVHLAYTCYGYRSQAQISSATGFNGQYIDFFTGHYQLGSFRTYNTVLMRFHSPDSVSPFSRGGLNAYAYCSGDPINYLDPSGHGRTFLGIKFGKKTIMQRREGALTAIEKNPVLEPYRPIAENSLIDKELRTLSRTGKALNMFTELMEKGVIHIDEEGGFKYHLMDEFEILSYEAKEIKVMKNEKTLNSLLLAYPQSENSEPNKPPTSLLPSMANQLTRM